MIGGLKTPAMGVRYQQAIARDVNLSREDVGLAVLAATDGLPIGSYYEGEHALPIYLKSVDALGERPGRLNNVPVWSMVPSTNGIGLATVRELMTGMLSESHGFYNGLSVLFRLIRLVLVLMLDGKFRWFAVIMDNVLFLHSVIMYRNILQRQPGIVCYPK